MYRLNGRRQNLALIFGTLSFGNLTFCRMSKLESNFQSNRRLVPDYKNVTLNCGDPIPIDEITNEEVSMSLNVISSA